MSQAKPVDIDSLAVGKQLDHAVMEHVLGWIHNPKGVRCADCWLLPNGKIHSGDAPISQHKSIFENLVLPEIERRGLLDEFQGALMIELLGGHKVIHALHVATPEECCRAILHILLGLRDCADCGSEFSTYSFYDEYTTQCALCAQVQGEYESS